MKSSKQKNITKRNKKNRKNLLENKLFLVNPKERRIKEELIKEISKKDIIRRVMFISGIRETNITLSYSVAQKKNIDNSKKEKIIFVVKTSLKIRLNNLVYIWCKRKFFKNSVFTYLLIIFFYNIGCNDTRTLICFLNISKSKSKRSNF